jgi:hypothetical protein
MKRIVSLAGPPLIPFVLVTLVLEGVVSAGWIPRYLVPAPSDVLRSMIEDRTELPDCSDHRDRAVTRDLVRFRTTDRRRFGVHRLDLPDRREYASRSRIYRSLTRRSLSSLFGLSVGALGETTSSVRASSRLFGTSHRFRARGDRRDRR